MEVQPADKGKDAFHEADARVRAEMISFIKIRAAMQYTSAITGIRNCFARSTGFRLSFAAATQRRIKEAVHSHDFYDE